VISRIEKDTSHKRVKKDHVLIGRGVQIEAIIGRPFPAAEFHKRSVVCNPRVEVAEPVLPPPPDFGMILYYSLLIDGEGEKEVRVKV
jgi:hypothetical protein